jgi:pimeloyl-ACP methyl ester carboxylesterase
MRKAFLNAAGLQVHYRYGGAGAPVVMLHPSPLSSAAVLPVAREIAKSHRVYALDTPGYGLSDRLPRRPQSLDEYLPVLAATLDALGLGQVCLYGCATGAQISIEFAKRYPQRVALLVLDTAGHIAADECERIVRDYFPDVRPRKDGSHLVTLWHMVRELFVFFPWCDTRAASRIDRDLPPPSVMQDMLLDYLRAGEHYDWAYRPAFNNERAERAQEVRVPAVLTRWESSIALRITDALIGQGLAANYSVLPLGPTLPERCEGIARYLRENYCGESAPSIPQTQPPRGRLGRLYVDAAGMQLHAIGNLDGTGRPLIALHSPAASAALMESIVQPWVGARPVIALDLPGNGESDAFAEDVSLSIERYALAATQAVRALDFDRCDAVGRYSGGDVALEMALQQPQLVNCVAMLGVPLFSAVEQRELLQNYCPSIAPRADGTHLITAWYVMRDQSLWFPYYNTRCSGLLRSEPSLDPAFIHKRVVELMKMGDRYTRAYAAEFRYALAERLPRAPCRVLLASASWEALQHKRSAAAALLPAARTLDLPDAFADWAATLEQHL